MSKEKKISVYLIEDYDLTRKAFAHLLSISDDFVLAGSFESAEEFLEAFNKKTSDIVLMDLGLPGMNGLDATKAVKKISPNTKVIILTSHEDNEKVKAALAVGANAYCLKDIDFKAFFPMMKDVYKGSLWLHPHVADIVNSFAPVPDSLDLNNLYISKVSAEDFTKRELEVLKHLVDGESNEEIAKSMFISIHTAKAHVRKIYSKLELNTGFSDEDNTGVKPAEHIRIKAVAKALRKKIVD